MRIGFGYDIHRLVVDRPCILGGVHIPSAKGLLGHSDADVLLHAIADALLGAAALGDIGKHFPDTDAKWKGLDSRKLLGRVKEMLEKRGFSIVNLDATVVAEEPRLQPHMEKIIQNLAETLDLNTQQVSVKATTNEGIGSIGRGEGIAAYAVALLQESA